MGEGVHRKKDEVIVNPEGYEGLKTKYLERYKEQEQKVLAKRQANSPEELLSVARETIQQRQERTSTDYKPLKDREILVNPKSEEVKKLKQTLQEETSKVAARALGKGDSAPAA